MPTIIKSFLKHAYENINEKADPYDEMLSVKALYDETSSDVSSAETLLARKQHPRGHGVLFALNIVMFCLSAILFLVSGYRFSKPNDPYNNEILRKSSFHCKIHTTRSYNFT